VPERQLSYRHRVISPSAITSDLVQAWQSPDIPLRQRELVNSQLYEMYQGSPPAPFEAAAQAVRSTGEELLFGERELMELFETHGLVVHQRIPIESSFIQGVPGSAGIITYVCRKR
jgi:hypothetical protein